MNWEMYRISPDGEAARVNQVSLEVLHEQEDAAYVIVFYPFKMIFIYIGRSAPPRLKFGASRFAKDLQKKLGPTFRLKTVEQYDESQEFLEYFEKLSKSENHLVQQALERKRGQQVDTSLGTPRLRARVKPVSAASVSKVRKITMSEPSPLVDDAKSHPESIIPSSTGFISSSATLVTEMKSPITLEFKPMTDEQKAANIFTDNATTVMFHSEGLAASTALRLIDSSLLPSPEKGVYVRRISWSAKKSTKVKDYQVKFYALPHDDDKMKLKVTKKTPQFVLKLDSSNLIGSLPIDMYLPPNYDLYVAFRVDLSMTLHFEQQ